MGNRESLLEAAVTCLRERGYGATTARDVAGAAGVSLGAIRYHYGSLEGLLNEGIAECSRRWVHGFQRSLSEAAAPPDSGLLLEADRLYELFESERTLMVGFVEAFAHAQRSPATRRHLATLYDDLRAGILAGLAGWLGEDQHSDDTVASLLLALGDGLMVQWLLDPSRRPDPARLQQIVSQALVAATSKAADHDAGSRRRSHR